MYKVCKTQQSRQRQRLIENVMVQMMLKEHFNEIKISELCQKAGIPRKAFYRYFDTKEDVLYAIVDHSLMDYMEASKTISTDTTKLDVRVVELFYKYWKEKKDFLRALEFSNVNGLLLERALYLENKTISKNIFENVVPNASERSIFSYAGVLALLTTWIHYSDKTPKEMAEITMELLTKPLFVRK